MDIVIPNPSGNPHCLEVIEQEVTINGLRRTDAYCDELTLQAGAGFGYAVIGFRRAGYDALLCRENDLVTVAARPWGTLFRGYITGRTSTLEDRLQYQALDVLSKFNDTYFTHEYNYRDEVTREWQYVYSARAIAWDAWLLYRAWKTEYSGDTFLLGIDLDSFPDVIPGSEIRHQNIGETHIKGMPLLQGLQTVLAAVDYRYRIKVAHTGRASIIRACLLGTGYRKRLVRGTRPDLPYYSQPAGTAQATAVAREVSSANTITHCWAEGSERVIETALPLAGAWNAVPNDFTPAEGHVIEEYVTAAEQEEVINNWERYTLREFDLKGSDGFKFGERALNPNYRMKYEAVCRRFSIPALDDTYYEDDDAQAWPALRGALARQVKIEGSLVQELGGEAIAPYIVYKRVDDERVWVKKDGFTIENDLVVEFAKPFVDKVSTVRAKGSKGAYVAASWSAGSQTSHYAVTDTGVDFTTLVTSELIAAGVWLILGEYRLAYNVISVESAGELVVFGNLSGAGVGDAEGKHWLLTDKDPFKVYDNSVTDHGAGSPEGVYLGGTGDEDITNEYSGMLLALGNKDGSKFLDPPSAMQVLRIAYNKGEEFYTQGATDLTNASAEWCILDIRTERARAYEWVKLNAAYRSLQRLIWWSGDLGTALNKRLVYKNNEQYLWKTMRNNYRLAASFDPGHETDYQVVFNDQTLDVEKQDDELEAWARNQIAGAGDYETNYRITLGIMDLNWAVGDCVVDNRVAQNAAVTGIRFDFNAYTQEITAATWG